MHHVEAQGARIPALGFGTFRLDGAVARRMVGYALEIGYRHIDTAQMYGNEAEVGAAVAASGVARDEIWLTTKIWPDNFRAGDLQRAAEASVDRLRTVPDLLLLHWPNPRVPLAETIGRARTSVKRRGLTRHIGISNCPSALIREAGGAQRGAAGRQPGRVPPLPQPARGARGAARATAWRSPPIRRSPRARSSADPVLERIGRRHGKNPGQVALRWLLQQDGVSAIPRSSREANAKANLEIFDFTLSADEMAEIAGLARPGGRLVNPAGFAPAWDRD